MKLTWGHWITIGYVLFIGYILYFVFTSFGETIDLVSEDYYAKEVAFQQRIEAAENAINWDGTVQVDQNAAGVRIIFVPEAAELPSDGLVYFFRPSDAALDMKLPLTLDVEGQMIVPVQVLQKGRYELQITWRQGAQDYYMKKDVFI